MYTNYPEPDYPAALGLISHLNIEELKELLNNDSKFEELLKDLKQFKELETEKEMIIASNRSLAEFNLSKEPQLEQGKERLKELSARGERLCQSIESKVQQLKQHTNNITTDTALALLQTAAAETEEESEKISEKFLEGDMDLETFLDQFLTRRRLMHLQRVKADKMAELMANRSLSPPSGRLGGLPVVSPTQPGIRHNVPSYFPLPPVGGGGAAPPYPPVGGMGSSVPYPIGGVGMPMPGSYGANVY
ncbi:vacuolar protein sorting-associated protein 37B [Anabrus simplex]|uniref:vacuolar protein sorting-associated protein 37B n=1 Tax=Anabrus simplex TaxID=316456 RepID=UPI0035A3C98B